MNKEITHRPKGRMCMSCVHFSDGFPCNELDFPTMQVIDIDKEDGMKVVKCDEFVRGITNGS